MERVENSRSKFPTLSTAIGNPANGAGFPHSHSADDGCYTDTTSKLLHATPASGNKGATQPSAYRRARKATAELRMAVRTVTGPWQELIERLKKLREGLAAWLAAAYGNEVALSFAG